MAEFLHIAKSFTYAGGSDVHVGPVILTNKALYLTSTQTLSAEESLKRRAGLLGHALSQLIDKEKNPFDFAVPIPDEVLADPAWPGPPDVKSAIVIEKDDAEKVSYPLLGSLTLVVNGVKFTIAADFMKRKRILALLREGEWRL